jgi:hypothetical protein
MSKIGNYLIIIFWYLLINVPLQAEAQGLPPGWDHTITSTYHVIAIPLEAEPSISGVTLSPGDYIGVFYWDEDTLKCGGASEWLGDQNIAVVAYGDDNFTTEKDGFDTGEVINFKMYSYDYEDDFEAIAIWDPAQPIYDGLYYPNGLSALLRLDATGPLTAQASAVPSLVCIGTTAQLFAIANGGTGTFSYSWSSLPEGFNSNAQNPFVTPLDSTSYFLEIFDGENYAYDTTQIDVTLTPEVFAGNDTIICENNSLLLSGEAQYFTTVLWSTVGDGVFDDATILNTTYSPGESDLLSGIVKLTLTVFPMQPCADPAEDNLYLSFTPLPEVDAGEDGTICEYESFTTSATAGNSSYILWESSGDGTFNDPTSLFATYSPGPDDITNGTTELTLAAYPIAPCVLPATDAITLLIHEAPLVFAGNDQSIPHGTTTTLEGDATGGSGSYLWFWEPAEMLVNPEIQDPVTLSLTSTIEFALTVIDGSTACFGNDDVVIYVTGGALSVEATALPEEICSGSGSHLSALPSGGSGDYSYSWTSDPPGFSSNLPDPMVYPETTTIYFVEVFDGFNTASASVEVTVLALPVSNAGEDQSIPYGTSTSLTGSATGGSGEYSWSWSPAVFLMDATIQNPQTVNLYASVHFELEVIDQQSGCLDVDSVLVSVSGSPLVVSVSANPQEICLGDESQLVALTSGGSGEYTFLWTSDPPGFNSSDPSPTVNPNATTSYFVEVDDGYNKVSGSTTVTVNSLPEVNISVFPNDTVCLSGTITLDATTQGGIEYLWSPYGQTGPVITVDSAGIGVGSQTFTVEVTNLNQCTETDQVTVTFDNCIGMKERMLKSDLLIYPNPATDRIVIEAAGENLQLAVLEIFDIWGRLVYKGYLQNSGDEFSIDISHWNNGLYIVFLEVKKHKIAVKKLIISH